MAKATGGGCLQKSVLGLLVLVGVIAYIGSQRRDLSTPQSIPATQPPRVEREWRIYAGEVVLRDDDRKPLHDVTAAIDKAAIEAVMRASEIKDTLGNAAIYDEGRAFRLIKNTPALILSGSDDYREVRLLDGPLKGKAVFVFAADCHAP